ncbi:MAG: hypothetical protein M1830_007009, partial [Pleopsidium flavum]
MAVPASSRDTFADRDVEMDDAQSSQVTTVDEGYQTSQSKGCIAGAPGTTRPSRHSTHIPAPRPSSPSDAESPESNEGLEILGRGVKELVQAIQALRQLGVEDLVLPLPKICVVGDQSVGKSSLIEAISEIKVPRSVGTCTRCPLEINLTESVESKGKWVCKVWLHKKYMRIDQSPAGSRARPLGPWAPQEPEDFLFATIHSKEEVGEVLYWAQLATLNPGQPYEKYTPGEHAYTARTFASKFSPNVVRLDISGPGLPNLSFYDLPGVINVAEIEEERYLVNLVKNLVKEYIRADDCINLLAIAMTDDAANSSAMGIIREIGAQNRTIGVLTKPDRVQRGESFEQWKMMLSGEKYAVKHGYYVVKNPGQGSLDQRIDHSQARAEEAEYFTGKEPWSSELSIYSERFGTAQLQTALSQKLTAQILTSLPRIHGQVRRKAESIEIELATLPEPPADNLPMILMGKLTTLNREISQYLTGGYPYNDFQKAWNNLAVQFRKAIADSRPALIITDPGEPPRKAPPPAGPDPAPRETRETAKRPQPHPQAIDLLDSEEEAQCKPDPGLSTSRKRGNAAVNGTTTSKPRKQPRMIDLPPFATTKGLARKFTLAGVRDIIQDAHVAGIPNQVEPKAIERMSQMSVEHWDKPMKEFMQITGNKLQKLILDRLEDVFGAWKQTALFTEATAIVNGFLSQALTAQREAAERVYRLENFKPMTYNGAALDQAREAALPDIRARRRDARIARYLEEQESRSGRVTSGSDRQKKLATITDVHIGVDPYHQEVDVIGTVRGYYDCAFSRFVDTICRDVQGELFAKCRNGIYMELEEELGVMEGDANERCARLMAEDPQREIKRAQLKREKEKLAKAQDWLANLADGSPEME